MVAVIAAFLGRSGRMGQAGRRLGRLLAMALLVGLAAGGAARAEGKVALVLGNGAYSHLQPLQNPVNDARGMAAALERIGFEVTLVTDAPRQRLAPVLDAFAARAESADTVLFYYAGHAFQTDGQTMLVPVDAALQDRTALRGETWSFADDIVARLADSGRQTLYFLDAGRESPVPLRARAATDGEGLAKPDTGTGSFVALATQPGAVARDGIGANSPFTVALMRHIETPGISVSDLMIRVRKDVVKASGESQVPWDRSRLRAQFSFVPLEQQGTVITEADLDAIATMDEASIRNVIGALAENGVTLEILAVEDDPAEQAADTPNPIVAIDEIADPDAGSDGAAGGGDLARLAATREVGNVREAPAENPAPLTGKATDAPTLADRVAAAEAVVAAARRRANAAPGSAPDAAALAAVELPEDLARGVQGELARVGCHRAAVDGQWGPVSRVSLLRYYTAKGSVSAEEARAEPDAAAFRRLSLEPGVVCEGSEAAPSRVAAGAGSAGAKRIIRKAAPATGAKTPAGARPAITTQPTTNEKGRKIPARINRLSPGAIRG